MIWEEAEKCLKNGCKVALPEWDKKAFESLIYIKEDDKIYKHFYGDLSEFNTISDPSITRKNWRIVD